MIIKSIISKIKTKKEIKKQLDLKTSEHYDVFFKYCKLITDVEKIKIIENKDLALFEDEFNRTRNNLKYKHRLYENEEH